MVGPAKSAGLLEFRVVFGDGHLVPMDQPSVALNMTNFCQSGVPNCPDTVINLKAYLSGLY